MEKVLSIFVQILLLSALVTVYEDPFYPFSKWKWYMVLILELYVGA